MGQYRKKDAGETRIDFTALLPIAQGADRPLQESERAQAMSLRIHTIAAVLNPAESQLAFGIPDGADLEDRMAGTKGMIARDVTRLWEMPMTAEAFVPYRWVALPVAADSRMQEVTPNPPYFTRHAGRLNKRANEMGRLGYYWGIDDDGDEGWCHRGPRNPDIHDIRGTDDISQYKQLCPLAWRPT
jgi:hypothetical protein